MISRRKIMRASALGAVASAFPVELCGSRLSQLLAAQPTTTVDQQITFAVDDVVVQGNPIERLSVEAAIATASKCSMRQLEAHGSSAHELVNFGTDANGNHPFMLTLNTAYDMHYPISLSPDTIWLMILQGLSNHVNENAQALRKKFVAHEGKSMLIVRRPNFRMGDPANDWPGVFSEFSTQIRGHIGENTHSILAQPFSTTGAIEKTAMELTLMDALQSYFVYSLITMCGFPSVTLEGTREDWQNLRRRAEGLRQFDLHWWMAGLLPMLDQFVAARNGSPDREFWCNFYKIEVIGSGRSFIQGHVLSLFPYLGTRRPTAEQLTDDLTSYLRDKKNSSESEIQIEVAKLREEIKTGEEKLSDRGLRRNPHMGVKLQERNGGIQMSDVPATMNSAPLMWNYLGQNCEMDLLAGFIGASQNPKTLALRPELGWAIRKRSV